MLHSFTQRLHHVCLNQTQGAVTKPLHPVLGEGRGGEGRGGEWRGGEGRGGEGRGEEGGEGREEDRQKRERSTVDIIVWEEVSSE